MRSKKCTHNSPPDKSSKVQIKASIHAFREKACPVLGIKAANEYYMNTYKQPVGKFIGNPNEVARLTYKEKFCRLRIVLTLYLTGKAHMKVTPPSFPPDHPA